MEADILPFPVGGRKNLAKSEPEPFNFFTPEDRFTLVVTSSEGPIESANRKVIMKVNDLPVSKLMTYFQNFRVKPRDPIEARHWSSFPTKEGNMQVVYDLHVTVNGEKLSLEQFNSINRMITNEYRPLLGRTA